ncbi:hypothetical protein ACLB2K_050029 [Fragaria x ananassa]
MKIFHGGRFLKGSNKRYVGGDVLYADGVDQDKLSMTELVYWAYDIGYERPPMHFWFRIPGSEDGSGFLLVTCDKEAMDMCGFVSPRSKMLELFLVCEAQRRKFAEDELEKFAENLDHSAFLEWQINDVKDGPNAIVNIDNPLLRIIEENERVEAIRAGRDIGLNKARVGVDIGLDTTRAEGDNQMGKNKRWTEGRDMLKKLQIHKGKKENHRNLWRRDSDDSNFDGIIDSNYDLDSEYDDVEFEGNVDGDTNTCHECDEMGFEGQISDEDGSESDDLKGLHDSSDEEGEDKGCFPVNCRKMFSNWIKFNPKVHMKNPFFVLGMEFPSSEVFKHVVRKRSVMTRKELRFPTNSRHKVRIFI